VASESPEESAAAATAKDAAITNAIAARGTLCGKCHPSAAPAKGQILESCGLLKFNDLAEADLQW